jgi:hypothetical protein
MFRRTAREPDRRGIFRSVVHQGNLGATSGIKSNEPSPICRSNQGPGILCSNAAEAHCALTYAMEFRDIIIVHELSDIEDSMPPWVSAFLKHIWS